VVDPLERWRALGLPNGPAGRAVRAAGDSRRELPAGPALEAKVDALAELRVVDFGTARGRVARARRRRVVEVIPTAVGSADVTALVADRVVREILTGIAVRRARKS
jgi:hypothetical protein